MLTELTIENFAIIDRLQLRLEGGFTVLTGETGAGKSIIIDALQLVLGGRASGDVVRAGAALCTVEAIFSSSDGDDEINSVLAEQGIEGDGNLILRREVAATGRSTARVNGRAVPIAVLATIGALLVDIHGQSDHLSLLRRERQLHIVDGYGDLLEQRAQVAQAVGEYRQLRGALDDLLRGQREAAQRLDLLRFQVQEIESAELRDGEEEELQAERNLLQNAERLTLLADSAYRGLQGEAGSVLDGLAAAAESARHLTEIDPGVAALAERLQAAHYEVEDAAQELRRYRDAVDSDPERLEAVEERLDLLSRLERKYGASVAEVLAHLDDARAALIEVETLDDRIEQLRRNIAAAASGAGERVLALSTARAEVAARLTTGMAEALLGLGLKATSFEVVVDQAETPDGLPLPDGRRCEYGPTGIDTVVFLVSFNPGEALRPLQKVASGGETSRFLLALKGVLAGADHTPTLIFDEVDVGVGGRHGAVVAARLHDISRSHQVLTITHLPQVAALADHHLAVSKIVGEGRTGVAIAPLDRSARVGEIAAMLSGTVTDSSRNSAEELLSGALRSQNN